MVEITTYKKYMDKLYEKYDLIPPKQLDRIVKTFLNDFSKLVNRNEDFICQRKNFFFSFCTVRDFKQLKNISISNYLTKKKYLKHRETAKKNEQKNKSN